MSQMRKPVMEVIRFTESDIVVASNGSRRMATSFSLTGVNANDGKGNGIANYNNTNYLLNSEDAVKTFISAMGVSNAGISIGGDAQSLKGTLNKEANFGTSGSWDGYYVYDPDAIWNNKTKDLKGVFYRQ